MYLAKKGLLFTRHCERSEAIQDAMQCSCRSNLTSTGLLRRLAMTGHEAMSGRASTGLLRRLAMTGQEAMTGRASTGLLRRLSMTGALILIALIIPFGLFSQEQPEALPNFYKKGMPADTIREYYENGALKTLYYPYKKTYKYKGDKYNYCLYIAYDENGNQVRYTDDRIGYEQKFSADSVLVSYMIYNRRRSSLKYYIEFFPGSTKKMVISNGNRYDYDENERLRSHWERKSVRSDKKTGAYVASIYFEEFDVSGDISRSGRFYTNLNDYDQWLRLTPEFPIVLDSVPIQDFKEIIYPRLNVKETYQWDYDGNKTIISRFEQQGDIWNKIRRRTCPRYVKDGLSYYLIK